MPTKYCSQCGFPNVFGLESPKKCEKCDSSFGSYVQPAENRSTKTRQGRQIIEDEYQYEDVPQLDKLDLIIQDAPRETQKIGNLVGKGRAGDTRDRNLKKLKKGEIEQNIMGILGKTNVRTVVDPDIK